MEMSKRDWKLFRIKITWLAGELLARLIKEYISLLSAEDKNASDKFWELEKKIKTDRRHPGVILNMEQSKAIYDIISLVRFGVISFDDCRFQ